MAAKTILIICAQALLVQGIYGQCANTLGTAIAAEEYAILGNALAGNSLAYGAGPYLASPGLANYGLTNAFVPSNGGVFAVTSISPIAPTGISVVSENAIEGALAVNGELPFLGAVALEGALPTAGAGGINYGCGSGAVGIVSENVAPAVGPAYPGVGYGLGYGAGLGGRGYGGLGFGLGGCGCGGVY